jgi:hypothetical protein
METKTAPESSGKKKKTKACKRFNKLRQDKGNQRFGGR